MNYLSSIELRKTWIDFYVARGHADIGSVSLIGDGTTGVLFNVAGMQPLMPYLLGREHPAGKRLCNVQGCVRTVDIDVVGDKRHVTFFEMMGSWSLGDYFKEDRTKWSFELISDVFGIPPERIAATVFEGDDLVPRDEETAALREKTGIKKENIYYEPKEDNWWELDRGPCGPDSELFFITDNPPCGPECRPGCDCGRYVEIGNDVFMQYDKVDEDKYIPLEKKNVDTGWGLERILEFLNNTGDIYKTDLFESAMKFVEKKSGAKYEEDENTTKAMRIVCDHIRTAVMLLGDENRLYPSNSGAGYILRRLIRRAVRYAKLLNITGDDLCEMSMIYIDDVYKERYPHLSAGSEAILSELKKETDKFQRTIGVGLKEFDKVIKAQEYNNKEIAGKTAFRLFETFGFPIELTEELAREKGYIVNRRDFEEAVIEHREQSRSAAKGGTV